MSDFDYKTFAESMKEQAQDLVPQEFSEENKKYVVDKVYDNAILAWEGLIENESENLSGDNMATLVLLIARWTVHKSCDLIRSQVPREYWDEILREIAFVIYETGKQAFMEGLEEEPLMDKIEYQVVKAYKKSLSELCRNNSISESVLEEALTYSNYDETMKARNPDYVPKNWVIEDDEEDVFFDDWDI